MLKLSLFRRRQIWFPSLLGGLLLIALAALGLLAAIRFMYPFLAQERPAPGARLLVIEGWLGAGEFDQAVVIFRRGQYERVVTTGGPIDNWPDLLGATNHADFAARYLRTHGLAGVDLTSVPAPASAQERSFLSAVQVRDWATRQGLRPTALDVFSSGVHARRSRMLYQLAFGPEVDVGVLSARPSDYESEGWWQTSAGAKTVLGELISLAWTVCCFHPGAVGSHQERWAEPRRP
jgi:hypothetical protein